MQENQFLLQLEDVCCLSSTYLSALLKCPVVTEPPQHMAPDPHSPQQQRFS